MAAAGSFAAVSSIFGSPVIGAVLIIEAAGLGGPTLPLVLLPGLAGRRHRLARLHRARLVLGPQHRRLVAEPVSAAAVRRPGLGRLRLDDRARRRRGRRRLRDHGARPLVEAARRPSPVPAHDRGRARWSAGSRSPSPRRPTTRPTPCSSRARRPSASLFGAGGDRSRSRRSRCCSCSRGSPGAISLGNFRGGPTFPALFLGVVAGLHGRAPARLRRDAGGRRRSSAPRASPSSACRSPRS